MSLSKHRSRACVRWGGLLAIALFFYLLCEHYILSSVHVESSTPVALVTRDSAPSESSTVTRECNVSTEFSREQLSGEGVVAQALSLRSGIAGLRNKSGILDPIQWRPEYKGKRENATLEWAKGNLKEAENCHSVQPPLQYPGCLVHINHHYKFIWIKGKKVGGTSLREPLGWICDDNWKLPKGVDTQYCSEKLHYKPGVSLEDIERYWDEYFVFAFVRNPYSRFASSYTYLEGLKGGTGELDFRTGCRHPFLQSAGVKSKEWFRHNVHHVMEQSSCLFTADGRFAVDFVGETEKMTADVESILEVLNSRKAAELPFLELKGEMKKRNANHHDNYTAALFLKSPGCLHEVEKNFWIDFERLDYSQISRII